MSTLPVHLDALIVLADAQLRDALTPEQSERLEAHLRESPESRDAYLDLLTDAANLRHWAGQPVTVSPTTYRISHRERVGVRASFKFNPLFASLAAGLLLTAAAVSIYVFAFSADPESPVPSPSSAPIATLIESTGTIIVGRDVAHDGGEYPAGEYVVESGSAYFHFTSGANVRTYRDTHLVVHGNMHATLMRGSVAVVCPESAKDFAISLPDGTRIVDLGTAFRVDLEKNGRASVLVTAGRVRVDDPAGDTIAELNAGHRVAVVNGAIVESARARMSFSEPFDTDAADANEIAMAYPRFTAPSQAMVSDGVLRLVDYEQSMMITASQASDGEFTDFLEPTGSYTVHARFGASGGAPVAYSASVRISSNASIEFGHSRRGEEYFRVLGLGNRRDYGALGQMPVEVPDIGFDIADGGLYDATITVTRLPDDSVAVDVTLADSGSGAEYVMPTLTIPAQDADTFLGQTDTIGIHKRGATPGATICDHIAVSIVELKDSHRGQDAATPPSLKEQTDG